MSFGGVSFQTAQDMMFTSKAGRITAADGLPGGRVQNERRINFS